MKILLRPLLFLTLADSFLSTYSQVLDVRICDSTVRLPITQYTTFLRTTKPVEIDSVIKSSSFINAEKKTVLIFNYDPYYYWFRIIIKNTDSKPQQLMLLMAPFGLYDGKLFQKNNGNWNAVAHTGLKYRFEDRSYQFTHHVFPFIASPNSTDTLYLSIDARNVYKSFGFALLKPKVLKMFENKIYFVFGIIEGLLILFFVLNISLFFALKEKLHLWYALYISMLFLIVMKNDLLDQQFLGLDSEKAFRLTPFMAIGALAIAILIHVVQQFLKSQLFKNKVLYHTTTVLKANVIISAVIHAFVFLLATDYRVHLYVFTWAKISTLLGICAITINCLYCARKGFKGAWFILSGSFVFMLGSLQRLFFPSTLSFLFPPTTFHIGIIVETFVISIALIYRFWSEKELQKQRENQIETQTLRDVSGEIHDNVAQDLAFAYQILRTMNFKNDTEFQDNIHNTAGLIKKTIESLRTLSREMKNEQGGNINMIDQIRNEFEKFSKVFKINFSTTGVTFELDSRKQANLIRIFKEIIQNAYKHSQASELTVSLNFEEKGLQIRIVDNGIGFDLPNALKNSNGLENIRNRCFVLNATHQITTAVGEGTEISIFIMVEK